MKPCFKRIILDVSDLQKDPIENIHYFPDEDNILKGYALIIGPEKTPYEGGCYMFTFEFNEEYPYKPPKVIFESNDGVTRYNPNFYRNGKVCLSILNTWNGEPWSACQSIRSILITLQMTMNENPLANEPGVSMVNHYVCIRKYNQIITFKNIEQNIIRYMENPSTIPIQNELILTTIKEYFKSYHNRLKERLETTKHNMMRRIQLSIYNQNVNIDYGRLFELFLSIETSE